MKQLILKITFVLALAISINSCNDDDEQPAVDACAASAGVNPSHPKVATYQAIIDKYVQKGLPGMILYVKTPQGVWTGAAGKASIETGEPMKPCSLIYSASLAKTFTAVSVMMLVEQGLVNLDAPISNYLPAALYSRIANFNQATVRQLLNHTSGIRDYSAEPEYLEDALTGGQGWSTQKMLEYVYDKDPLFAPGTSLAYSGTTYILLAKMVDQVTGATHANFFTNRIFTPLGLTDIYYKNAALARIPDSYRDLTGSGELTNVTDLEKLSLASTYGDEGILSLASNYATFIEAVFKGNLISPASRTAMTTWIQDPDPFGGVTAYGLGLMYRNSPYGYSIGHVGAGLGYSSNMFYFPDSDVTIVMGINKALVTPEDIQIYRVELWNEVVRVALGR